MQRMCFQKKDRGRLAPPLLYLYRILLTCHNFIIGIFYSFHTTLLACLWRRLNLCWYGCSSIGAYRWNYGWQRIAIAIQHHRRQCSNRIATISKHQRSRHYRTIAGRWVNFRRWKSLALVIIWRFRYNRDIRRGLIG
jgi:hypothetical protein